ncbi:hypothetical protein VaNZ11_002423 [Volvox africanus]|uniref:Ubiquitin-like protease family profile domain-containing protein n=1 Tax=Volvox africanus TaxID=51714 RepID=A0ABQ5RTF6_9CHLO|nr:hypothetical protein VaNZ11_002423 [Volvox africanus]
MMWKTQRKRAGELKVLDYHDVLLREQDISLLEGPHWLNDQVVAFFFEYLSREGLHGGPREDDLPTPTPGQSPVPISAPAATMQQPRRCTTDDILLLPPATSFLLIHSPPEMATELLAPLKPDLKALVLFAVNDNSEVDVAAGGSHWTLLVYHRPSNTLRHYDSSPASQGNRSGRSSGSAHAAGRLLQAVGPALTGVGREGGHVNSLPSLVEVPYMPRQTNCYDCGVYMLAVAKAVCQWWLRGAGVAGAEGVEDVAKAEAEWDVQEREMRGWLTPAYVEGLRSEVLEIIRAKVARGSVMEL